MAPSPQNSEMAVAEWSSRFQWAVPIACQTPLKSGLSAEARYLGRRGLARGFGRRLAGRDGRREHDGGKRETG